MTRINHGQTVEWWDRIYKDGRAANWTVCEGELMDWFRLHLRSAIPGPTKLLVLGAGKGHLIARLDEPWIRWTAVDHSACALETLRASGIVTQVMDLDQPWGFVADQFNGVFASEILEHLDQPIEALKQCVALVRHVFFTVPLTTRLVGPATKWIFNGGDFLFLVDQGLTVKLRTFRNGSLLAGIIER